MSYSAASFQVFVVNTTDSLMYMRFSQSIFDGCVSLSSVLVRIYMSALSSLPINCLVYLSSLPNSYFYYLSWFGKSPIWAGLFVPSVSFAVRSKVLAQDVHQMPFCIYIGCWFFFYSYLRCLSIYWFQFTVWLASLLIYVVSGLSFS